MSESFDLDRFVQAQSGGTWEQARGELQRGRKTSHWMWFIFPQIAGLGHSSTAQHYAISGLEEARAYLAHQVLGPRVVEASELVVASGAGAEEIFGGVDAMKLRSSMTLFEAADGEQPVFAEVLERTFSGERDEATLSRI